MACTLQGCSMLAMISHERAAFSQQELSVGPSTIDYPAANTGVVEMARDIKQKLRSCILRGFRGDR